MPARNQAGAGWKADMLAGKVTLMAAANGADVMSQGQRPRRDRSFRRSRARVNESG
jgi:hypothetical protein